LDVLGTEPESNTTPNALLVEEALATDGAAEARNTVFAADLTLKLVVIGEFLIL